MRWCRSLAPLGVARCDEDTHTCECSPFKKVVQSSTACSCRPTSICIKRNHLPLSVAGAKGLLTHAMGDAGYRGVSADQDGRYRNKEQALLKKLASSGQFPPQFEQKVLMSKVNYEVIKPWIADKVGELLGFEDDVVVEYIHGMLEDPDQKQPDPKKVQLSLTGFLESSTPKFMAELWLLLLSAQKSLGGIPQEFVEKKKQEMREARERDASAIKGSGAVHDYRARDGGPSRFDRSEFRSRGGGSSSGGRGGRFDDRGQGTRREFTDKSGNRTERVQDRGWGARSRVPDEAHPYAPSGQANDHYASERRRHLDDAERRPSYRDRRISPPRSMARRDRSPSPPMRSTRRDRSSTPDMRGPARSKSGPGQRGREESRTPELRPRERRPRSRSRSYSPPRYGRSRPRSYSRSPPRRYKGRRSSSSEGSSTSRRRSRSRSRSYSPLSRSPSPERLARNRARVSSRSGRGRE